MYKHAFHLLTLGAALSLTSLTSLTSLVGCGTPGGMEPAAASKAEVKKPVPYPEGNDKDLVVWQQDGDDVIVWGPAVVKPRHPDADGRLVPEEEPESTPKPDAPKPQPSNDRPTNKAAQPTQTEPKEQGLAPKPALADKNANKNSVEFSLETQSGWISQPCQPYWNGSAWVIPSLRNQAVLTPNSATRVYLTPYEQRLVARRWGIYVIYTNGTGPGYFYSRSTNAAPAYGAKQGVTHQPHKTTLLPGMAK